MSEEQIPPPAPEHAADAPPALPRKPRAPRKKAAPKPPGDESAAPAAAPELPVTLAQEKPAKPRRAPRKPKQLAEASPITVTADLFERAPGEDAAPAVQETPAPDEASAPQAGPEMPEAVAEAAASPQPIEADEPKAAPATEPTESPEPAGPRRRRKRRNRRGERDEPGLEAETDAPATGDEAPEEAITEPVPGDPEDACRPAEEAPAEVAPVVAEPAAPEVLPPLTLVSLGLARPPVLSEQALAALGAARLILGSGDALDRIAHLSLSAPQQLCSTDSAHLDIRRAGHAGSVLVVVGDGAADGPAPELLAELGPAHVRVLPGVGRVQTACAALGLSAEVVTVVDLRRAPLAALRGQLRAHRLLALPLADGGLPLAVARLLIDSGFAHARLWVCEFPGDELQAKAWLATELAELRDPIDPHAVLIVATGPSSGLFAELPGLSDAALGDGAAQALPLAVRALALAWLQPAAWENGWAIADGEASLALEWARAVPTARVRAVGMDPGLLGMAMTGAGVGENLSAVASAIPAHSAAWPVPEAVFIRGGEGLFDWLTAAWARLAPGGRLVATAEDEHSRAELLAFSLDVPAQAWQEMALSTGDSKGGRLRFQAAAAVRLALWRKPALS